MSPKSEVAIGVSHGGTEQSHAHNGQVTSIDPFIVEFKRDDPENPMNWSASRKWFIAFIVTSSVFAVTFTSSAYSDSSDEIIKDFNISTEVFSVGISLFILGFAVGPAVWAPLLPSPIIYLPCINISTDIRSELYGRKIFWIISHIGMVAFIGGTAGSRNITTLLVLRFFSGTFGGSPLVNAGGAIADIFPPVQRGLAMIFYSFAPLLGPLVGPIISGFVSENVGWRWVQGMCCIFVGVIGIIGAIFVPETYGPVLLFQKAKCLTKATGKLHVSILERDQGKKKPSEVFQRALIRPWVLLMHEPIVTVASIYIALGYGTTYMFMGAMPIVYNEDRGWSEGIGGLAFLGLAIGEILGLVYAGYDYHRRYMKLYNTGKATPESRLPTAIVGSITLPIGIFGFAWTNYPSIHWSASIILSAPFGFGCILTSLSITNYLVDSYTIYAATALAALAIVRSTGGAVFPLFTNQMYHNLGIHWASCVPGFLTVACIPFPIVMYRYGEVLRMKCKYTFEAAELMRRMQKQQGFGQVESGERVDEEESA